METELELAGDSAVESPLPPVAVTQADLRAVHRRLNSSDMGFSIQGDQLELLANRLELVELQMSQDYLTRLEGDSLHDRLRVLEYPQPDPIKARKIAKASWTLTAIVALLLATGFAAWSEVRARQISESNRLDAAWLRLMRLEDARIERPIVQPSPAAPARLPKRKG
jgi:hypothetical protein